ncbi:outer membrane protein assembly factor BamE [Psychromonas hadalis]|uniref:outer membrane protein assembly factor BamE n=1 Tax=Psychromonas hadalis TaxID=211669 RepID=UPI0003FB773F|nr:outer membrane protein assembly factor BamE [Psychromonas hadalis]
MPINMPIKKIASALFLTFSLSGCSFLYDTFVYQIDITQGNYIDDEKIAQLEIGMSQEQIIFILGSPMLIDQFDSSKWYYIRYIKPGGEKIQQQQVLLIFSKNVLMRIQKEDHIKDNPLVKANRKKAPNEAAESNLDDTDPQTDNSAPIIN